VEAEPARSYAGDVGDGIPLGGEVLGPLEAGGVGPARAVFEVTQLRDLAEQAGPDEGRSPDSGAEECTADRAAGGVGEDLPGGSGLTSSRWTLRSSVSWSGSGTVRRPARDFGYAFVVTVPATSMATRMTVMVLASRSTHSQRRPMHSPHRRPVPPARPTSARYRSDTAGRSLPVRSSRVIVWPSASFFLRAGTLTPSHGLALR
jgi:hypothetical protein